MCEAAVYMREQSYKKTSKLDFQYSSVSVHLSLSMCTIRISSQYITPNTFVLFINCPVWETVCFVFILLFTVWETVCFVFVLLFTVLAPVYCEGGAPAASSTGGSRVAVRPHLPNCFRRPSAVASCAPGLHPQLSPP